MKNYLNYKKKFEANQIKKGQICFLWPRKGKTWQPCASDAARKHTSRIFAGYATLLCVCVFARFLLFTTRQLYTKTVFVGTATGKHRSHAHAQRWRGESAQLWFDQLCPSVGLDGGARGQCGGRDWLLNKHYNHGEVLMALPVLSKLFQLQRGDFINPKDERLI